jgi:acetoacetyl-CoA synthetase
MGAYLAWTEAHLGRAFSSYQEAWDWSVRDPSAFWETQWQFHGVRGDRGSSLALADDRMPGARWFPGAVLNYAENALLGGEGSHSRDGRIAVLARSEDGVERRLTFDELRRDVARAAAGLRALGVGRGDRVVALLPNVPETLVAFLATASIGATWSSCSPEFGVGSVLDRFRQIEPAVLIAVDRYRYGGKVHDRRAELARVREGLPTLKATVLLSGVDTLGMQTTSEKDPSGTRAAGAAGAAAPVVTWDDFLVDASEPTFERVPFDHPLWILYSSGTTGLPKPIVHGHGGIVLEHFKVLALHGDLGPDDRFFWFTTTGWMMWNYLISGLLVGCTIVLYDGSPAHPDLGTLWRLAGDAGITYFGASAPYLMACRKAGVEPAELGDLSALRAVGSTGAPLPPEGFGWVYEHVKSDLLLASVSGGTDVCTAFILSCPLLPVHAGEIQCRGLGCAVEALDAQGRPVVGEVGELAITRPMPSMPIYFWNDVGGARYRESYFAESPGTWRHGDWIKITDRGSCVVYGRSDSTLNRGGVRMGTSELYRVVEALPEVADSLVVDTGALGHEDKLWLFVVLRGGAELDPELVARIKATLRRELSPRHVPDEVRAIAEVPRTLNGKKLEVPIKRILLGMAPDRAVSRDTLANPSALEPFIALRDER